MNHEKLPLRAPAEKLYQQLASLVGARARCIDSGNTEWKLKHQDAILALVKRRLPSGSGLDSDIKIDFDRSTEERLVLQADFHHMNGDGYYTHWTQHQVIVTPSLSSGFKLRITGHNDNRVKDYIAETFAHALDETEADWREPFEKHDAAVKAASTLSRPALLEAGAEGAALGTCDEN